MQKLTIDEFLLIVGYMVAPDKTAEADAGLMASHGVVSNGVKNLFNILETKHNSATVLNNQTKTVYHVRKGYRGRSPILLTIKVGTVPSVKDQPREVLVGQIQKLPRHRQQSRYFFLDVVDGIKSKQINFKQLV